MGSPAGNLQVVRFADCSLDLAIAELCRNGAKVILQDQAFQIPARTADQKVHHMPQRRTA
jgi:hypothetical protein